MSVPYLSDCGGPAQCAPAAAQARSPRCASRELIEIARVEEGRPPARKAPKAAVANCGFWPNWDIRVTPFAPPLPQSQPPLATLPSAAPRALTTRRARTAASITLTPSSSSSIALATSGRVAFQRLVALVAQRRPPLRRL